MPLSEQEQRLLEEMERSLYQNDSDFVARVTLTGVPRGATVRLRNVRCSTVTGTCEPEDF